jgi:hypothetical protein
MPIFDHWHEMHVASLGLMSDYWHEMHVGWLSPMSDYWHETHVAWPSPMSDYWHETHVAWPSPMSDYWHETHVASLRHDGSSLDGSSLGQEYLINDAGQITPVSGVAKNSISSSGSKSSGTTLNGPASTLVGSSSGLEINLIWDSSVRSSANWSQIETAVIDAAKYYTTLFSTKVVINIDVGFGEIDGTSLASNALGESESYGYLTNYSTVTNALEKDGYTFTASNEPTTAQFFVTSAEAKTMGLISGTSTAVDGYIGFSTLSGTGYSWNFSASTTGGNTGTGAKQFDLEAVAMHEISEVMGRIGMEGEVINGKATYTPLDLFNFKSPGVLDLSGNGGYFSTNDGATNLGTYNDASVNGGDIADWASSSSITQSDTLGLINGDYDAYDAFTFPGDNGDVSQSDILEDAALGYTLTAAGKAAA